MSVKELPSSIGGAVANTGTGPKGAVPPLLPNGSSKVEGTSPPRGVVIEDIFNNWRWR